MPYKSRVVLVLQDVEFTQELSLILNAMSDGTVDVDQYRELSRGAFIEENIDLIVLELHENSFSNISSMATMLDTLDTEPKIVLVCDDSSIKRAKDFAELGVVSVCPLGLPADLVALQINSILAANAELESLKTQVKNARNVAMLSMSASSQLGEVVRFQEKSYAISDFKRLGDMLIGSVNLLGAHCSGVFNLGGEKFYFGDQANRDAIMHHLEMNKSKSRFVDFEDGTLIYFNEIWVYLSGMPVPGSEEYGQLKDSIFPLIESAGQRAHTIMAERAAAVAERNKSWFLKNVSSGFREPMSAILNGTQLLNRRMVSKGAEDRDVQILSLVESSASQLADLIEDLLALSDAENIRVFKKSFSISEELGDTLSLYERWAGSKGIDFSANFEPRELDVYTDPKHFKQVLRSLLSNAVKYTDSGAVSLTMEKIGAGPSEFLEISVSDTGQGFDVDKVQPYLKPFVDLDQETIQEGDGAGLGLSVVVQLINQLDGSLNIESEPDKGSCFTLTLPVYKPEGAEQLLF
ncbi:MAG: HAMP domain-containing histidine kinase [Pseudomonadales bacterium]|nr:HAMP domain-containing histidine kinase [Pseudomonadales bacterium]